jgi:hypothetical protein
MNKTTTKQDLILYAYNESDLKNSDRIQRGIDGDPLVQDEFNEIIDALSSLDSGKVQPSEATLKKIMAFAKSNKA